MNKMQERVTVISCFQHINLYNMCWGLSSPSPNIVWFIFSIWERLLMRSLAFHSLHPLTLSYQGVDGFTLIKVIGLGYVCIFEQRLGIRRCSRPSS
ncbi:hypothetical protein P8452_64754 [Trifolium repens]|nr:hypothetical protein P8452_64754 [Trifolium repens]